MSIESAYGEYTPTCDGCDEELETEYDFYDAVDARKAAGWRSVKDSWGWQDYCPKCYQKQMWEE